MHDYHSRKMPVIPLTRDRKPFHKDWSRWTEELPEEPLYKEGQAGFGILPGKESGIMIVDIDTDDPELMKKLKEIIPTTPVQRIGSKGVGLIFSHNADIVSRKFKNIKVEIFASSGYVVLPPSFHEKTGKEYYWVGKSLLDFDKDLLPSFGLEVIHKLDSLNDSLSQVRQPGEKSGIGGRHDMLLSQLFAGLNKKTLEELIDEITWYDLNMHNPPWSYDELGATNPKEARAALMKWGIGVKKTKDRRIAMENKLAEEVIKESGIAKFEIKNYPRPDGVMGIISDLVEETAYTKVPNMAMGSALAIFSTITGNNFSFEGVSGNLFCLLLAESGTGKKFGIDVAKNILGEEGLIGSANYASSTAIVSSIHDYITRLDVSDEFSKVLKLMKEGGVWQRSMPQELCDMWSNSAGNLVVNVSRQAQAEKKVQSPVIKKPYISILAATTITEFKNSVNKSLFTSGLLPRCLIFIDQATKDSKSRLDYLKIDDLTKDLKKFCADWKRFYPCNIMTGVPMEAELKLEAGLDEYFDSKMSQFYIDSFNAEESSISKLMLSRKREFYKKLAQKHALSRGSVSTINLRDLQWAEEFFDVGLHNQQLFIEEAAAENNQQALKERIFNIILTNPKIQQRELSRKTFFIEDKKRRENLIQDLIEAGRIAYTVYKCEKNGKDVRTYSALT